MASRVHGGAKRRLIGLVLMMLGTVAGGIVGGSRGAGTGAAVGATTFGADDPASCCTCTHQVTA